MKRTSCTRSGSALLVAMLAVGAVAHADELSGGTSSLELRKKYVSSLDGKTVAYIPVALGITLTEGWGNAIRTQVESAGMKYVVRDPNWSTSAETQAIAALIAQKPAVMVVHNPNVQLLAKQLEQAQKAGIYVIQVNMVSNYKTDAYVGADWIGLGRTIAKQIVKDCGTGSGKSGKVAIVQGELTSATSIEQLQGAMEVLSADKAIKVVSSQAANWDAAKAHQITSTVVQQNPDLCATFGFWDVMELGAAQAVKEAGLAGKVNVYTSGDGNRLACDAVQSGAITKYWNYDAPGQGREIGALAKTLVQSGLKPGQIKVALYSPTTLITKDSLHSGMCWDMPRKSASAK